MAGLGVVLVPATVALWAATVSHYQPNPGISPVAAVAALKEANAGPVFNDYDFGGYLVFAGVPTFIDGRTELYGGAFTARHYRAVTLADLNDFVGLLDSYQDRRDAADAGDAGGRAPRYAAGLDAPLRRRCCCHSRPPLSLTERKRSGSLRGCPPSPPSIAIPSKAFPPSR